MQSSIVRLRGIRRGQAKPKSAKNDRALKEERGVEFTIRALNNFNFTLFSLFKLPTGMIPKPYKF